MFNVRLTRWCSPSYLASGSSDEYARVYPHIVTRWYKPSTFHSYIQFPCVVRLRPRRLRPTPDRSVRRTKVVPRRARSVFSPRARTTRGGTSRGVRVRRRLYATRWHSNVGTRCYVPSTRSFFHRKPEVEVARRSHASSQKTPAPACPSDEASLSP
jgi:hypothetical protein